MLKPQFQEIFWRIGRFSAIYVSSFLFLKAVHTAKKKVICFVLACYPDQSTGWGIPRKVCLFVLRRASNSVEMFVIPGSSFDACAKQKLASKFGMKSLGKHKIQVCPSGAWSPDMLYMSQSMICSLDQVSLSVARNWV